jgi:hypothetical protein
MTISVLLLLTKDSPFAVFYQSDTHSISFHTHLFKLDFIYTCKRIFIYVLFILHSMLYLFIIVLSALERVDLE